MKCVELGFFYIFYLKDIVDRWKFIFSIICCKRLTFDDNESNAMAASE